MIKEDMYYNLGYSIRKRGEDEIEIRSSLFDGYIRGFIRAFLFGIFCVSTYTNSNYGNPPFHSEIETIKEDFMWAFDPDRRIKEQYQRHINTVTDPEFIRQFPNHKGITPYEEYRKPYIERRKWERIRAYFHFIWIPFLLFLIFLPKARGLKVNRKKRIIYAPLIGSRYHIAFVPDKGDPLGGLIYSCYGVYPFGGGEHHSLQIMMPDEASGLESTHYMGVYPTVSKTHNADIVRAIRAYLTEENPAFLNHIGKRYKVWGGRLGIPFCNAFALPVPFSRKKANKAIDEALNIWNKKTGYQKSKWLNKIKEEQNYLNEDHKKHGVDNLAE